MLLAAAPASELAVTHIGITGEEVYTGDTEYRWRDGTVYVRDSNGVLHTVAWHDLPQCVRDAFNECANA